jgi:glycosyltransferase involved in cell wall biosynthesis
MNLTLVTAELQRGGAERVLSILANGWAKQGRQVTLITFDDPEAPAYPIDPRVTLESLHLWNKQTSNILQAVYHNFLRVSRLRKTIRKSNPGVVVSFLDWPNIVTLAATRGLGVPVIVSERSNPDYAPLRAIWKILRRKLYPCASGLVCQTAGAEELFQRQIRVPTYVIPNPLELSAITHRPDEYPGKKEFTVIAMGRLAPEKGFDLLIEAFGRIAKKHSNWKLEILGTGDLRNVLEAQVQSLGLQTCVSLAGAVKDPFQVLPNADMFVCSSRFEGFPNALMEGMASGLPAISFDCPFGPAEIIRDGVDGMLVPAGDVSELATAMDRLMGDNAMRTRLAARAPEVTTRFSLEKVLEQWDQLFHTILPAEERVLLKSRVNSQ